MPCEVRTRLEVAEGARLIWAPQETLLFEGARLERRLEADVEATGTLTIFEAVAFGRLAHGEIRVAASLSDRWRLRRGGKLVFAEALRIEDAGATLDRPAIGAGARAAATLVRIGPDAAEKLDPLRAAFAALEAAGGFEAGRQPRRRRAGRPGGEPVAAAVARGADRRLGRAGRAGRAEGLVLKFAAIAAVLALALAQALVIGRVELTFDEAYYALWARWPQAGYFDHPPLVAWTIAASQALFGHSEFGVRALFWLMGASLPALTAWIGWRLFADATTAAAAALIFVGAPLAAGAPLATPDTPLVFFWTLALAGLAEVWRGRRGAGRWSGSRPARRGSPR